mgnify:CR=1 FL=1
MSTAGGAEMVLPRDEMVDVLIIGAGASGATVAWSLAETKMRIVCMEQGDWMNPAEYPSTGRDWEARLFGNRAVGKAIWLFIYPITQPLRMARVAGYAMFDRWQLFSYAASALYALAIFSFGGGVGLLYLFASFWFSVGLHPLGDGHKLGCEHNQEMQPVA